VAAGLDRQGGGEMRLAHARRVSDILPIYPLSKFITVFML
jgi:hypothetical protein